MSRTATLLFWILSSITAAAWSAEPLALSGTASTPRSSPLWAGTPPEFVAGAPAETVNEHGHIKNVSVPTMTVFLPPEEKRTGMAIIVCPGGGYGLIDWNTHAVNAASYFNARGVAVIGLKYRTRWDVKLARERIREIALLDAKRAVRTVRHRAAEWHIDPRQIGIAGYGRIPDGWRDARFVASFQKTDEAEVDFGIAWCMMRLIPNLFQAISSRPRLFRMSQQ